jgi:hypothetical protein
MSKAASKGQEVAPVKESGLPAGLDLAYLTADSGLGVSNMGVGDVALPYLSILQGLSPQVNPGRPEYVEGAQASMFYNNVSQDVFDGRTEGLLFVPAHYERKFVEWIDRDKGGGFVADYDIDSDILNFTERDDKKRLRMKGSGNLLVETAYHTGLYFDPELKKWLQCVVTLKSTGLKVNRRWNNELTTAVIPGTDLQAPRWLFPYLLTKKLETKAGNSWWQLSIEKQDNPVTKAVYDKAKGFYQLLESGQLSRAPEVDLGTVEEGSTTGCRESRQGTDTDIPF